ncbi:MAG: CRP/FNR family cyclic AMP-dependent transcriptional regulator [Candidatus Latescibacterota bacterium]|jgi:CRP/FNR family cyclic AMP-dependent transcriptional regulator
MSIEETQELAATIGQHIFFRGLTQEHLQLLASCAEYQSFESNQHLGHQGEKTEYFYLVLRGRIVLETSGVSVQAVDPDEILGWSWFVPPYNWRFDARALEKSRTIALEAKSLRDLCDTHPNMGYELLRRLVQVTAQRLETTRQQLVDNTRRADV